MHAYTTQKHQVENIFDLYIGIAAMIFDSVYSISRFSLDQLLILFATFLILVVSCTYWRFQQLEF